MSGVGGEADMPRQLNRRDWSYRAEAGFKNERVFRNVGDPNEIIIFGRRQAAQNYAGRWQARRLKAAMKEAGGVAGTLKLHVIPYSSDAIIA
jgi:hypothetical protein